MPNTESERRQCYDAAIKSGIPAAAIRAFLADNPEDECRINSALAPNAGPGSVVTPLYQIPGLTSYSGTFASPRSDVPIISVPVLQGPGSNANPLSTVSANSVVTGPAISRPNTGFDPNGSMAVTTATCYAGPDPTRCYSRAEWNAWSSPSSSVTAAPGSVMAPAVAAPTTGGAAAAPAALAGVGNTGLLLAAAAVVAFLVWGR